MARRSWRDCLAARVQLCRDRGVHGRQGSLGQASRSRGGGGQGAARGQTPQPEALWENTEDIFDRMCSPCFAQNSSESQVSFISTKGVLSARSTFEKGNLGLFGLFQNIKIKNFDTHIAPKVKKWKKKKKRQHNKPTERRKPQTSEIPKDRRKPRPPSCPVEDRTCATTPGSCQCTRRLQGQATVPCPGLQCPTWLLRPRTATLGLGPASGRGS